MTDCLIRDRKHQAIALKCAGQNVVGYYARLSARGPGKTCILPAGPVKEVIWKGAEARLDKILITIPAEGIAVSPLDLQPEDFLSPVISGAIAVTKHPDTNVHNCFFTMAKVYGESGPIVIFSHHTPGKIFAPMVHKGRESLTKRFC